MIRTLASERIRHRAYRARLRGLHPPRWTWSDTRCLRGLVLDQLGSQPQATAQIYAAVVELWGEPLHRRRLERALAWQVARRAIQRTAGGYVLAEQRRAA